MRSGLMIAVFASIAASVLSSFIPAQSTASADALAQQTVASIQSLRLHPFEIRYRFEADSYHDPANILYQLDDSSVVLSAEAAGRPVTREAKLDATYGLPYTTARHSHALAVSGEAQRLWLHSERLNMREVHLTDGEVTQVTRLTAGRNHPHIRTTPGDRIRNAHFSPLEYLAKLNTALTELPVGETVDENTFQMGGAYDQAFDMAMIDSMSDGSAALTYLAYGNDRESTTHAFSDLVSFKGQSFPRQVTITRSDSNMNPVHVIRFCDIEYTELAPDARLFSMVPEGALEQIPPVVPRPE